MGDRPRGRFATPADSPRQDCSPYSQVHVRRESLGFVHRSRSLFCRPRAKPWQTLRFAPVLRCLQNTTTQRTPQGCGRARSTGTLSGETASAPHPRRVLACPVTPPRTRDTVHACVTEKSTHPNPNPNPNPNGIGACEQVLVGLCYESGAGVDQSHAEAATWFRAAVEQNDPQAMVLTSRCPSCLRGERDVGCRVCFSAAD